MENLGALGLEDNSVDVVISNCVINLSPDKRSVFSEIFRVLKPSGELCFSDIFAGCRVPEHFKEDPILHGECLAGALYIEDFRRLLRVVGCPDYRVMLRRKVQFDNPAVEVKIGMIDFYAMTVRAFKIACLEDFCEDFGQSATYLGTIPGHPPCLVAGRPPSSGHRKAHAGLRQYRCHARGNQVWQIFPYFRRPEHPFRPL